MCSAEGHQLGPAKSGTLRYRHSQLGRATKTTVEPRKTELIWFGGRAKLESLQAMDITMRLAQVDMEPVDCVRDLGVLLDSSLSMHQHIARVTSTCFFHLRRLRKLSHILDVETRKRLVCVDYCNFALAGLSDSTLALLQRVLHAAARFKYNSNDGQVLGFFLEF